MIAFLTRLANDAGVRHVCQVHGFKVGCLTELLPHEHPNLLGLNENMGQRISLRIRTDAGDGMRSYLDARKVLLHELAHNKVSVVWGDVGGAAQGLADNALPLSRSTIIRPSSRSSTRSSTLS